jgi:hypothetical protein
MSDTDVSRSPGAFVSPRGTTRRKTIGGVVGGLAGFALGIALAAVFGLFDGWIVAFGTTAVGTLSGGWAENRFKSHDHDPSPLQEKELGYLAVLPESITLFSAEGGVFRPRREESVLATMPRTAVNDARLIKGRILEIAFQGDSSWAFDVRKSKEIRQVFSALSNPPNRSTSPAAGWYPDPRTRYEFRYWDGLAWTHHVSGGGQMFQDPDWPRTIKHLRKAQ